MTVSLLGHSGGVPGRAVFRQWRLLPLGLFLLLPGANVQGQRLLDLGPVIVNPEVAEPGVVPYAIDLDIDLIRSAPQRVEVPAPDGRLLVAELSVFKDRGGGDAMWAGKVAGSDYESVVFTVANGHLVGHFGVPGGPKYRISARPSGQGRIENMSTMDRKPKEEYCPGGVVQDRPPPTVAIEAQRGDEPERVVQASNHNHLDMLILYSENARARYEARDGSVDAPVQASIDYLNTVFRNGQLDLNARLVHHEEAPDSLAVTNSGGAVLGRMRNNREVQALRAEHQADLVHIFVTAEVTNVCGIAYLLGKGATASSFSPAGYGLTVMQGCGDETFAHEVGHNLGGWHDPANAGGCFEDADCRNNEAIAPYAFGHTWFSPSPPNPPHKDTIMSYGSGEVEPWFSTVRVQPRIDGHAVTFGIAGERENERAIREYTVPIAPRYSDSLPRGPGPDPGPDPEPPPPPPGGGPTAPGSLTGRATGATSVRLMWEDRSDDESGFEVQFRRAGGRWTAHSTLPANTTTADVTGLTPGERYDFRVRAFNASGRSTSNTVRVTLSAAEYTDCVPAEPLVTFEHGYTVGMCVEYLEGGIGPIVKEDAKDYGLVSRESGILYFFDRDNAEVLVKVLNPCAGPANNGYLWVFVAPVTDLAFNLHVTPPDGGEPWVHRNPRGGATATTRSDVTAFPCDGGAAALPLGDGVAGTTDGVELVGSGFAPASVRQALTGGEPTDCEPQPVLTLGSGYEVAMCYETSAGDVGAAEDWGLDSTQSGLLYFFDRNNAEVLVKVLESACGLPGNDHVWVYVAPVTDLAFNLAVTPPDGGDPWTHSNNLSQTAAAKSDNRAFACSR
jgi:hypothetical protein